ncbi:MAG: hypothetical protein U9N12_01750 [Euryarchaeota archaeon]|nr:hypothetical protein [Euryarchaeota archaeon]
MCFRTADDPAVTRFYPFVERTIGGVAPTPPPDTIPATDADGDGVPGVWDADNSTQDYTCAEAGSIIRVLIRIRAYMRSRRLIRTSL